MSVANNDGNMSEMQNTLYICFIDYTKAFHRVKHDLYFEILSKAGVPDKEINIIKNRYLQQKATVRHENETSEEITIKQGVRQGTGGRKGNKHQWTKYHKHQICRDDTIILAESEQQLQHMIDKLDATCEQYGMAMNAKKTKTMIVEKHLRNNVK